MTGRLETSLKRAAGCEAQALTAVNPHSREAFLKAVKMWRAEARRATPVVSNHFDVPNPKRINGMTG